MMHLSADDAFYSTFLLVLSLRSVCMTSFIFTEDTIETDRYQKGKEKYELFKKESSMPQYSACWTDALNSLERGCRHLSDDVQHRLALKFSNCFLEKTGRDTYECADTEAISACAGNMAPEAYNVYAEFFTHTQNICYFLQAQAWQEETEKTVAELSDTSAHVARQLEDSSHLQTELLLKQNESIRNQEVLLSHGVQLKRTLEDSTADVHVMLKEFKDSTSEQKALIFEVFDRLTALQRIVMGEFTGFYSLIFYTVSVLVCYLLTSTPRTSGARFWLFLLMTVNVIIERLIVAWGSEQYQDADTGSIIDESTQLYSRLWWCRKFFSICGIAVWGRCAIKYQDYNKINNQLLVEIRKQNSDLKHLLQKGSPKPDDDVDSNGGINSTMDTMELKKPWEITPTINRFGKRESTTGYESEFDTGAESDFVSTFKKTNLDNNDAHVGVDYLSNLSVGSSLHEELHSPREMTPPRVTCSDEADISSSASPDLAALKTKRGSSKATRKKKPPSEVVQHPVRYSLRSRAHANKARAPSTATDSQDNLEDVVHHLAMVTKRNKVKTEVTLARSHIKPTNSFSSEED